MDWIDTKKVSTKEQKAFVIINDVNKIQNSLDAFKHYDIQSILWNEREKFKGILAT